MLAVLSDRSPPRGQRPPGLRTGKPGTPWGARNLEDGWAVVSRAVRAVPGIARDPDVRDVVAVRAVRRVARDPDVRDVVAVRAVRRVARDPDVRDVVQRCGKVVAARAASGEHGAEGGAADVRTKKRAPAWALTRLPAPASGAAAPRTSLGRSVPGPPPRRRLGTLPRTRRRPAASSPAHHPAR
jgi:hypothetical protein